MKRPYDQEAPAYTSVVSEGETGASVEEQLWDCLLDDGLDLPVEIIAMYDPEACGPEGAS